MFEALDPKKDAEALAPVVTQQIIPTLIESVASRILPSLTARIVNEILPALKENAADLLDDLEITVTIRRKNKITATEVR